MTLRCRLYHLYRLTHWYHWFLVPHFHLFRWYQPRQVIPLDPRRRWYQMFQQSRPFLSHQTFRRYQMFHQIRLHLVGQVIPLDLLHHLYQMFQKFLRFP